MKAAGGEGAAGRAAGPGMGKLAASLEETSVSRGAAKRSRWTGGTRRCSHRAPARPRGRER